MSPTRTVAAEPRARGARLPRDERRAQLLDAAQQVFVAQGYHATGMDDIAGRAGVSKPVLYQHFPGKLDLYLALLEQSAEALVDRVRSALDDTTDNKLRVYAAMQAYYAYVDDTAGTFRLVFESDLTAEERVRARVERTTQRCAELVSDVIAEDAGLSRDEAMLVAVGLTGMAQVSARYWLTTGGAVPRDAAATLLGSLAWRGVRGFPRPPAP